MNHLKELEELRFYGGQYTGVSLVDISPLRNLAQLTKLEKLDLDYNGIVDISPLTGLTQLKELSLGRNEIVDISPLTGLTQLSMLDLGDNKIADVSPLEPLRLQTMSLYLYHNRISDFSPIEAYLSGSNRDHRIYEQNLDQIVPPDVVVNISDAGLRAALEEALDKESGAPIMRSDMESLTTLDASNRGIRKLHGLSYATNLTALDLTDNEITDAWSLGALTQLIRLELAGNKLTGVAINFDSLKQLQYLDFSRNLIANVNALSVQTSLSSVTTLNVSGNHIADVSPLAKMTQLNELYLSDNPDTDYSSLATLLETLDDADFSYDPPVEIPDANLRAAIEEALGKTAGEDITQAEMETLQKLNAKRAGITDITGLEYAINLRQLDLSRNKISDVSPLAGLTQLKCLYLNRNKISDFSAIAGITDNLKCYKKGNQKTGKGESKNTPTVNTDVNRDDVVDATDLDIVSRYTGLSLDSVESGLYPDVNGDGKIDTKDVRAVTERLGPSASGTTQ